MNTKPLIGILICLLLLVNGSTVLGFPEEKITTMRKTDSPTFIQLFTQDDRKTTIFNTQVINEIPHGNIRGPNLAPNPSFEEGDTLPEGWMYNSSTTGIYHWDSDYAHSGEKSVGIMNLTNNSNSSLLSWTTIDFISVDCTNYSYILRIWFKFLKIPPECHFVMVYIQEYDNNHQIIGTGGAGLGGITHTEWSGLGILTHYDNTKYVKLEIGLLNGQFDKPDPSNELRLDDVNFCIWNTAPNKPTITGKTQGRVRTSYDYTIITTDPDQQDVRYEIDWGDNKTQLTEYYKSGEEIVINHTWDDKGTYEIKVRAIDYLNKKSNWTTLTVIMPTSYTFPFLQYWMKFHEKFPNAFPIIHHFLRF